MRTSPAFAARFSAEAKRSGLSLDLAEAEPESKVRVCPTCGAQNSRFVTACFNCQTELHPGGQAGDDPVGGEAAPAQKAVRRGLPEARWHHIANAPRSSTLPLRARSLVHARFAPLPPVARVESTRVLGRFLEVFVEREEQRQKAPVASAAVQRFDQRSALDKFLSVFVERHATHDEPASPAEDSGTFEKVLGLFVERKK